jgi:hypothetical protein
MTLPTRKRCKLANAHSLRLEADIDRKKEKAELEALKKTGM